MLEGLVVWVLNNYLGKYVENLNTDQLSVALLSGKVELENLPLRKDALRHLGLPVEVRAGFIGKVQLQVPVRQIRSAPWIISIERLYVVVAPVNLDEWDSAVEATIAHERKVSLLDAVEAQWRAEREAHDPNYYATSYSSWLSYGTGLLANIVENLQLKINDVHFRYEDTTTVPPSMAFACGLTVNSLSAESCDKAWNRGFTLLSDSDTRSYKLVELDKLSVYWEPRPQLLANCDLIELQSRMSPHRVTGQCVLPACGGRAAIRRERTAQPLRSRARPRLHCRLTLAALSLHLSDRQYESAARCGRGLALLARRREWRALRPSTAVRDEPRAWWVYAVKCHLPHHTWTEPAPTWQSCLRRARAVVAYVELCAFLLANPAATLPPHRKALKDDVEWNLPLHLLKALREVALSRLPRPGPTRDGDSAGRSILVRWFPQWWGWYRSPDAAPAAVDSPSAVEVEDLEEEILDVIADSLENNTLLKRDTVFGEFEFLLDDACLILHEDEDTQITPRVEVQLCAVRVHMMSRPRASSLSLSLSVGDLSLRDRLTVDTLFPVLVASQGMIREGLSCAFAPPPVVPTVRHSEPLFLVSYETKPAANCDYKLYVKSQSLEVVYNRGVVRWVSEFLSSAASTLADTVDVPHTTKMKLMNHWEQILQGRLPSERTSRQIELDVSAPQILLVEEFTDRDGAVLLIDFGKMRVTNGLVPHAAPAGPAVDDEDELFMTPCSTPPASPLSPSAAHAPPLAHPSLDHSQLRKRLYDTYAIELSDLQVLVGRARDNWKFAHTKSTSTLHILDRFNISLQAERRVVHTSDPQFPAATVCGALPTLVVHLSEQKLAAVGALTDTLTTRHAESPAEERAVSVRRADSGARHCATNADAAHEHNTPLFMVQFAVEQMSLEVQSRGRSIAEVQVCGVRMGASGRPCERSLSLSVHSLLLVDALQTYGPDYELLVASHKHIGMDLTSGSILGSEPSSPRSTRAAASSPRNDVYDTSGWGSAGVVDAEALIAIEICFVKGDGEAGEDIRIANILFNNLDIIANQETIVELIGFVRRVSGATADGASEQKRTSAPRALSPERTGRDVKTEITFDFHRLGVLLLRAGSRDGAVVAKKIATATLSDVKIQATLDGELVAAAGSLGAVQVVSQRTGSLHRRLLSVSSERALDFTLSRSEGASAARLRVASVTYTHCPATVAELRSCGAEFAQYLSNLARSIRNAAADMAIGLMQTGGQSGSREDGASPRRRTASEGTGLDRSSSTDRLESEKIALSVSVELETPVVVLPCAVDSTRVFVAQLGRMTLVNKGARYYMRLRDISLYTTDASSPGGSAGEASSGKPVLHDTALHLTLRLGDPRDGHAPCEVTGGIVGGLRVSSTREQYEQLLRTVRYMGATDGEGERGPREHEAPRELDAAVTLRLDPHVRAQAVVPPPERSAVDREAYFRVNFGLPAFTVELRGDLGRGERGLVDLSFSDLNVNYERVQPHETGVQVSLHSVTMEDLTKDVDSKHRMLMVSHTPRIPRAVFVSKSCPDFVSEYPKKGIDRQWRRSLDELESGDREETGGGPPPPSPSCDSDDAAEATGSSEDDLVSISLHTRDPKHPLFEEKYKKVSKFTKVDFNCLNLVISIDSWVVVLDFFGISDENNDTVRMPTYHRTPDVSPDDIGAADESPQSGVVELCGRVRALSAVLVWRGRELLRARVQRLRLRGAPGGAGLRGTVGALALEDLSRGRWRDILGTSASDPLAFSYQRFGPSEAAATGFASASSVECGGLRYVHTKRTVGELLAFLRDFSLLQRVLARRKAAAASGRARRSRVRVTLSSVVMRVPVSQHSPLALEATLQRLAVDNRYMRAGEEGTVSFRSDADEVDRELLNVRSILLERVSLYCVRRGAAAGTTRAGPSLLTDECTIRLQVEHNVHDTKNVPDLTIYGCLESLEFRIDPSQYSLIRGVLAHNLGEDLSHIDAPKPLNPRPSSHRVWTLTALKLDLQNVAVNLELQHGVSSLARINFIKSRLSVENYSDLGQDVDLVSQEILVSDSRYRREPANRRGNVFGHIVRPLPGAARAPVQAEVHARRKAGHTAYTVLLNAVRLMAVMDWWDSATRFLGRPPSAAVSRLDILNPSASMDGKQSPENVSTEGTSLEIKLNISESQLVFVEDASVWDTNAVILKSTTVMSYRSESRKPLSCSLNDVQVYSCVLGLEHETSLPIVEPASVHADLDRDRVLHIQTSTLNLRLSYQDMRMFAAMLKSIPAQAKKAAGKAPANSARVTPRQIANDSPPADDARIVWPLMAIEVRAESVTLCVIDDCMDSDVPLLELCLQDLRLEQDLRDGASAGALGARFSADYYNRSLSGWEPVVEPWRVNARWECRSVPRRLRVELCSEDALGVNITRTLLALLAMVRQNWTEDLYTQPGACEHSPSKSSPSGHRRRSPFVPYALCNETGHRLWFTTLVTTSDTLTEQSSELAVDESWTAARPGETVPFCCAGKTGRDLRRKRHQLAVRVAGWRPLGSVSMDRVADYCRVLEHEKSGVRVPILIQISLEGSARKLVTLRGGLQLRNELPHPVEVRVDHAPTAGEWGVSYCRTWQLEPGGRWSAPLSPVRSAIWARPSAAIRPAGPLALRAGLHHAAAGHGDNVYRFCYTGAVRPFPGGEGSGLTVTLLPALRIENLLPSELAVEAAGVPVKNIPPGDVLALHEVNAEEGVEISVRLEGFGWSSALSVSPAAAASFGARLRLQDPHGRRLYLDARTRVRRDDAVKVSVSAAYWLVNKSGMPLVLGADGGGAGLAGQSDEHERARAVAPLVFCLPSPDAAPTLQARLGRALYDSPEWCSPFGLGPGTAVKRLEARDADGNHVVMEVGVTVRVGRGRYRHTNIVTISPRYQIHNNTSYTLHLAQKCDTLAPKSSRCGELIAAPGCFLPWQWSSPGREPLLAVRSAASAWSGGFRLQAGRSLHFACKESAGGQRFFRAEVVCQGATLFVVVSDARGAPPPLALYNYSPVTVMVAQCGAEETVLGARTGRPAALPEPELSPTLWLRAPGGPRIKLDLRDRDRTPSYLTYQNFVYVAFGATVAGVADGDRETTTETVTAERDDDDMLVLEVPAGTTRVVLAERRYGDRSQLWKRGPAGQLVHEGSSPPQQTDAARDEDAPLSSHAMVLDIEGPAPRPGALSALRLRRADPRRSSTQTWRCDSEGRLTCAHAALCVMPDGGLFGLRRGDRVVLGLRGREEWQRVRLVRLRPGSGRLRVTLGRDGPTTVLAVTDPAESDGGYLSEARGASAERARAKSPGRSDSEWSLAVSLCGAGVSLVAGVELAHMVWSGLSVRAAGCSRRTALSLTARDMQWDNQLLDTPSPVLLHQVSRGGEPPVLSLDAEITHCDGQYNALFFKHSVMTLQPVAIRLEERLILKLWQWFVDTGEESPARELPDEADYETQRMLSELTAVHATRYYFGLIKIMPSQIRLSMYTANKLERDLSALKRHLGLTLMRFEDAAVELQPFEREHQFETAAQSARTIIKHFKDQLKWQAAKILGSVDFLGNPLGFVSDVSEGVSGLIYEGSVGALLQNITHGISNSAAKVTESLGDGLERVVVDEAHEETRRKIRNAGAQSHLLAGVRGLGLGLLGGVTSLVKHSYEGAAAEGVAGFLAGVGKGLVGTVTKPVIGVLDLAAETASAVRDTSRRSDRWVPERIRDPRCVWGGLLSRYSRSLSTGAALLHQLSGDAREVCVSYRCLRAAPHDVRALLSERRLRLVTVRDGRAHALLETALGDLVSVAAVSGNAGHYVELGVRGESGAVRRPRVQCDSAEGARWLSEHAAYATALYYDAMHTIPPDDERDAAD